MRNTKPSPVVAAFLMPKRRAPTMSTPTRLEVLANAVLNCLLTHQYQAAERYMRLAELTILDEGQEQP